MDRPLRLLGGGSFRPFAARGSAWAFRARKARRRGTRAYDRSTHHTQERIAHARILPDRNTLLCRTRRSPPGRATAADCRPSPGPWVDHYSLQPTCMDGAPARGPAAATFIGPPTTCQDAVRRYVRTACDGTKYNNCAVWCGDPDSPTIFVGARHPFPEIMPSPSDDGYELLEQGPKVVAKLAVEIAPHCPDGVTVWMTPSRPAPTRPPSCFAERRMCSRASPWGPRLGRLLS